MSLTTGNQLKAARALAGIDQQTLADAAGVNVNTIRNMEARGGDMLTSGAVTIRNVQLALEARRVEFLNHGEPGVRLHKRVGADAGEQPSSGHSRVSSVKNLSRPRSGGRKKR